jgi:crotonobetainyl-CoA:carnitine CoA-transferase CaiB-like acyl-CoA transferase
MQTPLKNITVLEFSQYLSGPLAGLRLADLGARVIKIERPGKGDASRQLSIKNLWVNDSSLLFHTINRNKESFAADLKNPDDLAVIKELIGTADVMTHNFRPGVMEKYGLHYEKVKEINPRLIYTEISGYGNKGPWHLKPGQDLLIQSMSGLTYATGNKHDYPMPFGLAIGDYLCGNQAVQGILAALIRRHKTGKGSLLQLSLMESLIDFQFEFFTTYFQTNKQHERSEINNAHSLLSAPYGIYQTADGHIAVAMMSLQKLASVIECDGLTIFSDEDAFEKRDAIKKILTNHFLKASTQSWLQKMHAHDLWVMPVLNWQQLQQTEAYQTLQVEQEIKINEEKKFITTRCPIRINREKIFSATPAPEIGEHTRKITMELLKLKA